jgi:nucleotide-binding universal stress UspA family protein
MTSTKHALPDDERLLPVSDRRGPDTLLDTLPIIERVLLASDLSPEMARAHGFAVTLARMTGAAVTLLHALDLEGADVLRRDAIVWARSASARRAAIPALTGIREAGVECELQVCVGRRWQVIVDAAYDHDLVIIGGSRYATGDVRLGTTPSKVVGGTPTPVLVVPA